MIRTLLTPAARWHTGSLARALAPAAARLDRQFRSILTRRAYDRRQIRAFLAITPAAASRLPSAPRFLEQVAYQGRRLAMLNVPPGEVSEVLREFDQLLDPVLDGQFQPAREQLHLATMLALEGAFYSVREAETQAFFGLYQAEAEAPGMREMLRHFVRILTRTFRARAGRLLEDPVPKKLSRPLYIERGSPDIALIADPAMRGRYASYWSYPLSETAVVQLGFAVPYPWLPRELALLEAAAERCRKALERTRLEEGFRRLEIEARQAEEQERRRIGRELHDEAGQSLLLLRLQLEMLEHDAPAALRARLAEARGIAERTVLDLRRIVSALSPAVLERLGLDAAIRHLVARFHRLHPQGNPVEIRTRLRLSSEPLPMQIQEVIYRVTQECLQNIAKHSRATRVNLSLELSDKNIRLSVKDNGAGFEAETARSKPMSFGLAGMRERAALLGGTLAVSSAPGKGVAVSLQLPRTSARGT